MPRLRRLATNDGSTVQPRIEFNRKGGSLAGLTAWDDFADTFDADTALYLIDEDNDEFVILQATETESETQRYIRYRSSNWVVIDADVPGVGSPTVVINAWLNDGFEGRTMTFGICPVSTYRP